MIPTQQEMDELRESALAEIKKLQDERDMWQARAMAMFWRLSDNTLCGDLRRDTETALAALKTSKQT